MLALRDAYACAGDTACAERCRDDACAERATSNNGKVHRPSCHLVIIIVITIVIIINSLTSFIIIIMVTILYQPHWQH